MVTAYTVERHKPRPHQRTTASGRRVRKGVVALSHDLEHTLDVAFGDWVILEGMGTFVFESRTARPLLTTGRSLYGVAAGSTPVWCQGYLCARAQRACLDPGGGSALQAMLLYPMPVDGMG